MRQDSYFGYPASRVFLPLPDLSRKIDGDRRSDRRLYFRNELCFGAGNLYEDLFSIYLQPSVNKNSYNRAFLTLQSDDVTVSTFMSCNTFARLACCCYLSHKF